VAGKKSAAVVIIAVVALGVAANLVGKALGHPFGIGAGMLLACYLASFGTHLSCCRL